MFTISDQQYYLFRNLKKNEVISTISDYLVNKYPSKVESIGTDKNREIVAEYVNWAIENSIIKIANLEYFVSLCFKYSITYKDIIADDKIRSIIQYPDRNEDDILFNIHYYFKYERNI